MTQKFNVGDIVRVVDESHGFSSVRIGDLGEIVSYSSGVYQAKIPTFCRNQTWGGTEKCFELVQAKLSKKDRVVIPRITALEAQVAELTAKVVALEKAVKPLSIKSMMDDIAQSIEKAHANHTPKSPNEQRKDIIAEAKSFVEEMTTYINPRSQSYPPDHPKYGEIKEPVAYHVLVPYFTVKAETREVSCVLKCSVLDVGVVAKEIAKCAPDDVFNADIGKAIALGRALGLDVSKFKHAFKPTEVVVGHRVKGGEDPQIYRVISDFKLDYEVLSVAHCRRYNLPIIDDTDAQY